MDACTCCDKLLAIDLLHENEMECGIAGNSSFIVRLTSFQS